MYLSQSDQCASLLWRGCGGIRGDNPPILVDEYWWAVVIHRCDFTVINNTYGIDRHDMKVGTGARPTRQRGS